MTEDSKGDSPKAAPAKSPIPKADPNDPIKRVPTGITGFDELMEGGFPEGATCLISGTPGAAKSTFCLQYIAHQESVIYNEENILFSEKETRKCPYLNISVMIVEK